MIMATPSSFVMRPPCIALADLAIIHSKLLVELRLQDRTVLELGNNFRSPDTLQEAGSLVRRQRCSCCWQPQVLSPERGRHARGREGEELGGTGSATTLEVYKHGMIKIGIGRWR